MKDRPRILVVERGCWLPFSQALATDADVLLFTEWREIAPSSRNALVGRDFPGIERVDSLWKHLDEVDVIAFPDIGDGDMQQWLRKQGYSVWGSGDAEMLELDRAAFKDLLEKQNMPVGPYEYVVGLDALVELLKKRDDLWVKTSFFRNDFETWHHLSWATSELWIDTLRNTLGPHADEIELIVEEAFKACEIGYDGFCIDGEFPKHTMWGLELKDKAYLGQSCVYTEIPACLQDTNAHMAEALKLLGMRGNWSTEVRIAEDGTAYFTDPTARCPSPPIGAQSVNITNWVDIVVGGANGHLVDPEYQAQFACEIELESQWLLQNWLPLQIPDEVMPWVRLRRAVMKHGVPISIPHPWMEIAGSAVGLGDTPQTAIDRALEVAEQVQGYKLTYDHNVKDALLEGWDEVRQACESSVRRAA